MPLELRTVQEFCSSSLIRLGTIGTIGGICLGTGEYFISKEISSGAVLLTAGSAVLAGVGIAIERHSNPM